jgi:glutathione S-transferase
MGGKVGSLRKKLNVPYPKMDGPDEFLRAMRIHYNALETNGLFLVLLLLSGMYWPMLSIAGGVIYMVGRFVYGIGYMKAPEKRVPGAVIFHLGELIMLIPSIMFIIHVING